MSGTPWTCFVGGHPTQPVMNFLQPVQPVYHPPVYPYPHGFVVFQPVYHHHHQVLHSHVFGELPIGNSSLNVPVPTEQKETSGSKSRKHTRSLSERKKLCGFCKSNRAPKEVYKDHLLRDEKGNVTCPILRKYVCPLCYATGDSAHTISYCPVNQHP